MRMHPTDRSGRLWSLRRSGSSSTVPPKPIVKLIPCQLGKSVRSTAGLWMTWHDPTPSSAYRVSNYPHPLPEPTSIPSLLSSEPRVPTTVKMFSRMFFIAVPVKLLRFCFFYSCLWLPEVRWNLSMYTIVVLTEVECLHAPIGCRSGRLRSLQRSVAARASAATVVRRRAVSTKDP